MAVLGSPGRPSLERPTVLVGPEGGWSSEEESSGLPQVGLGRGVLRTETAAVRGGCAPVLAARRRGVAGMSLAAMSLVAMSLVAMSLAGP